MKRIILDYLSRWKWIYLSGFVIHATVMVFAWMNADKVIPFGVFMGSAFLLMFEFFRGGGSRTLLSLPVTSKDVARAWRFVALEFPALFYLVALALSALFAALIKPTYLLNFERFLIIAVFQTLLLGTMFFALSGLPGSPAEQRTFGDSVKAGFFGLMWGFSIPGCIFLAQGLPENFDKFEPWHWLIAAGLGAITVIGWFRAESLVLKRSQQFNRVRSSAQQGSRKPARSKERASLHRFGGVPFYCFHFYRLAGVIGLIMIGINWSWMGFFSGNSGNAEIDHQFTASQINFVVPIMTAMIGVMTLGQLRSLRSLPLSLSQICGILILWPMVFGAVFGLVVALIHWLWFGPPFLWEYYGRSLAGAGVLLLIVPAFVRLGFTMKGFLVIFVMFPLVQVFQLFDDRMKAAVPYLWMLILILIPIAFWLTNRGLKSSYPWRAGALRMKGMLRR